MGDKDKSKISSSEMENLSLDMNKYPRDLLTRFMGSSSSWREGEFRVIKEDGCGDDDEVEDEIELNLGLSLGGRLGIDKGSMKLVRSSSIAECLPVVKNEDDPLTSSSPPAIAYSRLFRTTSLPLGSDEELRKRKELQTLRRMEAKKRRSEKQKTLKGEREVKGEREEGSGGRGSQLVDKDRVLETYKQINSWVSPPFGSPVGETKGKGMQEFGLVGQLGSVESHGGSSSEVDNRSIRSSCGDTGPGNSQSWLEINNQEVGCSSSTKTRENLVRTSSLDNGKPSKQSDTTRSDTTRSNQTRETRANGLEDMPGVFTKGDGPNGRRVDGILYKYGRGQEVRIMCICHGSFHSPAEFVKHAGGTDITHPLKHIVINPNATPFS